MIKSLSKTILFKWMGWKTDITVDTPSKCIIAVAPHTSNFDFIIGLLFSRAVGLKANFLMKKEWFAGPLGPFMKNLGGIPVYRDKKNSLTDQLAETSKKMDSFRLAITPEGTRTKVEEWKKGFYYIALKAEIPILLYGLDFKEKKIVCHKQVFPDGNIQSQMQEIVNYFKPFQGKHPEKFGFPK